MSGRTPGSGSPIGKPIPRVEDQPLLRGTATFIADVRQESMVHLAFLRSPVAHARITRVDLENARRADGVIAAFSAADLDGRCEAFRVHLTTPGVLAPERSVLAKDRVRYVGEPIAVVVARTRYLAEDAVERIELDYEPLPVLSDCDAALQPGAEQVHDNVPGNVYFRTERSFGDVDAAFSAADVILEGEVVHPRVTAAPMECRGVVASPTEAGGVLVWSSTQCPHLVAEAVAECCRLEPSQARVVAPDIGGGFGVKAHVYTEEVTLAWVAIELGLPVSWVEDRLEHLQAASPARDQRCEFRVAARQDGTILGIDVRLVSDIGAYGIRPHGPLLDPMTAAGLIVGPYAIENYRYDTIAVATNKTPEGPYRGVGMATAALIHERLLDLVATEVGIDPAEARRRNFIAADQMPYTAATGHPYESGDHGAALDIALLAFDYAGALEQRERARAGGRLVGIGIGSYVEFTGGGSRTFVGRGMIGIPGIDTARTWIDDVGTVRVQTSSPAIGQGTQTTLAQVVAGAVGVDVQQVLVEQTDTASVSLGTGSFQSRSSVGTVTALHRAAGQLREGIVAAASHALGVPSETVDVQGDSVLVSGSRLRLADLMSELSREERNALDVEVTYDSPQAAHPLGSHICMVEVDPDTGGVEILRYVVGEDCGHLINPMIVDGQVVGGIAQGLGAVVAEEIVYSDEGQMLTSTFMDYLLPTASEVADVEIKHMETPTPIHDLGFKGIGEGGTIGATAAVANAVADAIGLRTLRLPLTPSRIFEELDMVHEHPVRR
jgi:carbon-monoxide dehydrogenase large subunit